MYAHAPMPTDNRQTSAKVMMRQYCFKMAIDGYFRYLSAARVPILSDKAAYLTAFGLRRFFIRLGLEFLRNQIRRRIALANDDLQHKSLISGDRFTRKRIL